MEGLRIRKLADRTVPVNRFDPVTGDPLKDPEPYTFAGLKVENDGGPPASTRVSTKLVSQGRREGWLSTTGETVVHRPSGPADDPWGGSDGAHTFVHLDTVVLHTVDGDVTYRVTHQPDKYVEDGTDDDPVTSEIYAAGRTRVDHFYDLELEV